VAPLAFFRLSRYINEQGGKVFLTAKSELQDQEHAAPAAEAQKQPQPQSHRGLRHKDVGDFKALSRGQLTCSDCGRVCKSQAHLESHGMQHTKENRGRIHQFY
jgi:hypothetical protein